MHRKDWQDQNKTKQKKTQNKTKPKRKSQSQIARFIVSGAEETPFFWEAGKGVSVLITPD